MKILPIWHEKIFCPRCGYILEQTPTFRKLGWYRSTYSICPCCLYLGLMRVGRINFYSFNSINFAFKPSEKVVSWIKRLKRIGLISIQKSKS